MAKNNSEKLTNELSEKSFLGMYIYENPNKKCIPTQTSDEFCDCLIHMVVWDIIIQVKECRKQSITNWFESRVLKKARRQLTISCGAICSPSFEIWDKNNNCCIVKGPKDPKMVLPVIVFDKKDVTKYQQIALSEKGNENKLGYVGCNIFSIEDFKYATSMIPTGKDFVDYLFFRFNELSKYEFEHQLFPLFSHNGKLIHLKNATSNEQILISEFLIKKYGDNFAEMIANAKRWRDNLRNLENDGANKDFLQLLSYLTIGDIGKWDDSYKILVKESEDKYVTSSEEPVLTGDVDGNKCGIIFAYIPVNEAHYSSHAIDLKLKEYTLKAIESHKLNKVFIIQYTKSKFIRLSEISK